MLQMKLLHKRRLNAGSFCIKEKHTMAVYWVNLSKRGGKDGVFQGLAGLLRGISRGRSLREIPRSSPASPRKTPSCPTLLLRFTFYFYSIGPHKKHRRFRIGLPKIHRRFRIGPPKIHRRFRIGPPQVTLNLLLPEFHSRWILVYHGYYVRKATKVPIWNRMCFLSLTILRTF